MRGDDMQPNLHIAAPWPPSRSSSSGSAARLPEPGKSRVRVATRQKISAIVEIHQAAFPRTSFLSQLGRGFLAAYYALVLEYPEGILLVGEHSGKTAGFVAGLLRPLRFYQLMMRRSWRFAFPVVHLLVRRPWLLGRVSYSVQRVRKTPPRSFQAISCELTSIAVAPEASGRGLGKELVHAFLQQAWARGAECVFLTTDAENNAPTNKFYSDLGFHLERTFQQYRGRLMNEWVYFAPAIEPCCPGGDSLKERWTA